MKLKNIEMEHMVNLLSNHLERTDKIGYAAARNTRILQNAALEYLQRREQLVNKYGETELDESGRPTGRKMLKFTSPAFKDFAEELEEYALIEHDVDLFKIPYDEAIGKLSGSELLSIDFIFEE